MMPELEETYSRRGPGVPYHFCLRLEPSLLRDLFHGTRTGKPILGVFGDVLATRQARPRICESRCPGA